MAVSGRIASFTTGNVLNLSTTLSRTVGEPTRSVRVTYRVSTRKDTSSVPE